MTDVDELLDAPEPFGANIAHADAVDALDERAASAPGDVLEGADA